MLLPDDGGELMVDDGGSFFGEGSAEDQDLWGLRGVSEGFADGCAFGGVGYAQEWGSGAGEDGGA